MLPQNRPEIEEESRNAELKARFAASDAFVKRAADLELRTALQPRCNLLIPCGLCEIGFVSSFSSRAASVFARLSPSE